MLYYKSLTKEQQRGSLYVNLLLENEKYLWTLGKFGEIQFLDWSVNFFREKQSNAKTRHAFSMVLYAAQPGKLFSWPTSGTGGGGHGGKRLRAGPTRLDGGWQTPGNTLPTVVAGRADHVGRTRSMGRQEEKNSETRCKRVEKLAVWVQNASVKQKPWWRAILCSF